ncbi:OmpA family protein [Grimontia sp. S25]|uniref:OmpA family protein n=1 Tax=Grimontia sedimenti TaxID=2711294 RepID=A0A6M1RDQ2_9GAMM|nr:OmpA family protein [Grimontia sedimenti]NGN98446.1 OmpA family protein [Grimontia sedimenti]
MKKVLIAFCFFTLVGCSANGIESFPENDEQSADLRDLDLDGVIEAREKCDSTVKGAVVDNEGCSGVNVVNERITLNVLFANGSAYVNPKYYSEIAKVAEFMADFPYSEVTIEGHASAEGPADVNKRLSLLRAKSIAALLSSIHRIDRSRIQAIGYGEERLLDESDTPEAHQLNRRVVADIRGSDKRIPLKWTIYTDVEN